MGLGGLRRRHPQPRDGERLSFFLSFLTYPSSAFVPISTMPHWLQGFARNQPITHLADALRGLLLDQPAGTHAAWAAGWSAGLVAVSVAAATTLYLRRMR